MNFVFIDHSHRAQTLATSLAKHFPSTDKLYIWPNVPDKAAIDYAIIWQPEAGTLQQLPNLKAIFSLGAGVDSLILQANTLPANVPIVRYVDTHLTQGMAEYALYWVLHYHRYFGSYAHQQRINHWQQLPQTPAAKCCVGIMGLGDMGLRVINALKPLGYQLFGFSRTPKNIDGVESFISLENFLPNIDILINVLPLTPSTMGILNKENLKVLPQGAKLINMGRGGHHVLPDIIELLDCGHLGGATLDVFETEPLPKNNPAWFHPAINVTPHIASISAMPNIVAHIFEQVAKLQNGQTLDNVVDVVQGY